MVLGKAHVIFSVFQESPLSWPGSSIIVCQAEQRLLLISEGGCPGNSISQAEQRLLLISEGGCP